jgi:opacity protein-like surface antigen
MHRRIVLLMTLALLSASRVQAQPPNVASKGDKAILFNFVGLNNLGLNGYMGGFGAKYFLSNGLALRALLQFGIDDSTTKTTPKTTDNTFTIGVGGAVEYHLPLFSSVSPYLGGEVGYITSTYKHNHFAGDETKTTSTTFEVGALGGVEYYFNQNLSLGAEYQFGLSTASTTLTGDVDRSSLRIGFQTAGLTMAVYF